MTGWYKAGSRWHAAREGHNRSLCGKYPAPAGLDTVAHGKVCVTCSDLAATRYACATCHDDYLTVRCPLCGADRFGPCETTILGNPTHPHAARIRAWRTMRELQRLPQAYGRPVSRETDPS